MFYLILRLRLSFYLVDVYLNCCKIEFLESASGPLGFLNMGYYESTMAPFCKTGKHNLNHMLSQCIFPCICPVLLKVKHSTLIPALPVNGYNSSLHGKSLSWKTQHSQLSLTLRGLSRLTVIHSILNTFKKHTTICFIFAGISG